MTVLFGSVEYFQEEIATNMTKEQLRSLSFGRSLEVVYSAIEYDLLNDFVCSETMREELLGNFEKAYRKVRSSLELVSLR